MLLKMMSSKIHRATVTQCDPDYVGSITIDENLLRACGMRPNEHVLVADMDNGSRYETYVIRGEAGSGVIGINGAAAHLTDVGHRVIIISFAHVEASEADAHVGRVVVADAENGIGKTLEYASSLESPAHA